MIDDCHAKMEPIDIIQLLEELSQDRAPGCSLFATAAIELRGQRARIAALEAEVSDLNECLTLAHMDGFEKGRDAARAAMEGK